MPSTLAALSVNAWRITPKTIWTFVELTTADGLVGVGEATLNAQETAILATAKRYSQAVLNTALDDRDGLDRLESRLPFATLAESAFSSALLQAAWDAMAQMQNRSLCGAVGGARRNAVPTYANINRRTLDRSPAGFAASARDAMAAGFSAFKIAPFDGLQPGATGAEFQHLLDAGVQRIAAVRDAIGPTRRLMVDCHWRFDEPGAMQALQAVNDLGLDWFECPIAEQPDTVPALRRLRGKANALGMRLTGCETEIRREGFRPFLEGGAYDVMMPDVKYAGGPAEMLRIAEDFDRFGVAFSPHNPSGPICYAASLHIAAAAPNLDSLELQFDETDWFHRLVGHALPPVIDGRSALPAAPSGIGVRLQPDALAALDCVGAWSTAV
jgi:galactonate dehydratase